MEAGTRKTWRTPRAQHYGAFADVTRQVVVPCVVKTGGRTDGIIFQGQNLACSVP